MLLLSSRQLYSPSYLKNNKQQGEGNPVGTLLANTDVIPNVDSDTGAAPNDPSTIEDTPCDALK